MSSSPGRKSERDSLFDPSIATFEEDRAPTTRRCRGLHQAGRPCACASRPGESGKDELQDAEIQKKANVYHDGKVTSRTVITPAGEMKALGVMLPGTYRFSTQAPERIDVTQGHCRVKAWLTNGPGGSTTLATVSSCRPIRTSKSRFPTSSITSAISAHD